VHTVHGDPLAAIDAGRQGDQRLQVGVGERGAERLGVGRVGAEHGRAGSARRTAAVAGARGLAIASRAGALGARPPRAAEKQQRVLFAVVGRGRPLPARRRLRAAARHVRRPTCLAPRPPEVSMILMMAPA